MYIFECECCLNYIFKNLAISDLLTIYVKIVYSIEMRVYNKRSNILQNNEPVLPTPSSLEYGELSINYAAGHETIAIKNDNNEIVTFTHGKQGPQGANGSNGTDGKQGPQGVDGTNGKQGPQGVNGSNGTNGTNGKQGPQGPEGPSTIPTIGTGDEGKVLKVVNGIWALVTPINVYSGSGTPPASVGIGGDLYLQTS